MGYGLIYIIGQDAVQEDSDFLEQNKHLIKEGLE